MLNSVKSVKFCKMLKIVKSVKFCKMDTVRGITRDIKIQIGNPIVRSKICKGHLSDSHGSCQTRG